MNKYIWLVLAWLFSMILMIPIVYCYNVVKYTSIEKLEYLIKLLVNVNLGAVVIFPTTLFLGIFIFILSNRRIK
jgi:hypothetical protein